MRYVVFPLNITTFFYIFIYKCTSMKRKDLWAALCKYIPEEFMTDDVDKTVHEETLFYKYLDGSREMPIKIQCAIQNIPIEDIEKWVHQLELFEVRHSISCLKWMIEKELVEYNMEQINGIIEELDSNDSHISKVARIFQKILEFRPRVKLKKDDYKLLIEYKEASNNKAIFQEEWPGVNMRARIRHCVDSITTLKSSEEYYAFLYVIKCWYENRKVGCTAEQVIERSKGGSVYSFENYSVKDMTDMLNIVCLSTPLCRVEKDGKVIYQPESSGLIQLLLTEEEVMDELGIHYLQYFS